MDDLDRCTLDIDTAVEAGDVLFEVENRLPAPYALTFDFLRLDEGYSFDEFAADVSQLRRRLEAGPYAEVAAEGWPEYATVGPAIELQTGETGRLIDQLSAGTWAVVCTVPLNDFGEFLPIKVLGPIEVDQSP